MSRKSWLPIVGGLLLLGILVMVWRGSAPADGPLPQDVPARPGKSLPGERDGQAGGHADGAAGKRSRPARDGTTGTSEIKRALAELQAVAEDDLADQLEKTTATWPKDDLPSTVDAMFARDAEGPVADSLRLALLSRWATYSPAEAAAWALSMPSGAAREAAINQVALAWFATDPQAAWGWASGLEAGATRDAALISLAYELSRNEPALAFERSGSLPEGPARTQLIEHAVANWAVADPQAALAQVREIGDGALRNSALGRLATSWAESDPQAAATLAADAMEPGPAQERAVASIVQRWAQQDPDGAKAWVATFPDGPMKQNALEHIERIEKMNE
jgi:hypothetical protein